MINYSLRSLRLSVWLVFLCTFIAGCTQKKELGNVLRVGIREKYKSLDPVYVSDHYSHILSSRTYEALYQYHYLKRPYVLEPQLADGFPEIKPEIINAKPTGRIEYIFTLKKGVRFQDDKAFPDGKGRELIADDLVYSFKRVADPRLGSEGWWIFDQRIFGLNEWREKNKSSQKTDYSEVIPGLMAIDRYKIKIILNKNFPQFLHYLAMAYSYIVAKEAVEKYGKDFGEHPVGTGPFRLESISPKQLIWIKNPNYRTELYPIDGTSSDVTLGLLKDSRKPLPFVDRIIDDIIIEDQPAWLNFMQGNHEYLEKIPKDNVGSAFSKEKGITSELRDRGMSLFQEPEAAFNYIGFNMEDSVVGGDKNKTLRKAMSLAFDEVPAIQQFYLGVAIKAEFLVPPGISGYDSNYRNPNRAYNLAKAREMLGKMYYQNDGKQIELTYDTTGDSTHRQIAEYFQRQMALLGVKVKIQSFTWPELLSRIRKKQSQMFGISWQYDFPDAENGYQLLYGRNISPGSNEANYNNLKYNELYEKAITLPDGPVRNEIFKKMRDIAVEDCPWIFTVHRMENRLTQPWLYNLKIHAFETNIEKYLRVDVSLRKETLRKH